MMQIHLRKNKRLSSFLLINTLSQVACYQKVDPGLFLQVTILSMVGQELVAWASQHVLPQARMGMGPAWRFIWRDLPVKATSDWLTDPTQQHSEWLSNTCLINASIPYVMNSLLYCLIWGLTLEISTQVITVLSLTYYLIGMKISPLYCLLWGLAKLIKFLMALLGSQETNTKRFIVSHLLRLNTTLLSEIESKLKLAPD